MTGEVRAVKVTKKEDLEFGERQKLLQEIEILKELDHPSICRIIDIFEDKKKFYFVQEYLAGGGLFESLIQTMYETEEDIFFSKCVRVDKHFHLLSQKERIIIKKVIKGESYIEISEDLGLTINTIKTHMKNIFNKYNVHSKIELYNKVTSHIFY